VRIDVTSDVCHTAAGTQRARAQALRQADATQCLSQNKKW